MRTTAATPVAGRRRVRSPARLMVPCRGPGGRVPPVLLRVSSSRVGRRAVEGAGCGGGAGEEVAGDVGDEVDGAGGAVEEVDRAVGARWGR